MIEPVVVDVTINRKPAEAFELFTRRIAGWWPLETHSLGASDNGGGPETVVMEPHVAGRIYELSPDGAERLWGSVTAWEPGVLVAFTWHVGRAPESGTHVTVRFQPADAGGTHITLTHDNWHMLGEEGPELRGRYLTGWTGLLNDRFAPFAQRS